MSGRRRHALAPFLLATVLAVGLFGAAGPQPVAAGTAETMEASILSWMNADRKARGLRPLFNHGKLADLAGYRAGVMAEKDSLGHSVAGSLSAQLAARGIQWYRYGEAIGWTSASWGSTAASHLYRMWKGSPPHWGLMMSDKFNYVGVGVAYRNGKTYAALVFTESVDQTRPVAKMSGVSRSGTTVTWTWTGWDRALQTHTAGLRDFDVQYRVGSGSWSTVRNDTTAKSLTLSGRPRGTSVALRVRSRDWRGLLSNWSPELRVSIP